MSTHGLSHYLIFLGYLAAMVGVPWAFGRLIALSVVTVISGAGFFLLCGLTHVGLATGQSDATWVAVTDHLQALAIWVFVPTLALDLERARKRIQALLV